MDHVLKIPGMERTGGQILPGIAAGILPHVAHRNTSSWEKWEPQARMSLK